MTASTNPESLVLNPSYRVEGYNPSDVRVLLSDELDQRRQSGYQVTDVVSEANLIDATDREAVLALVDALEDSARSGDWTYEEPTPLADIEATLIQKPAHHDVDLVRAHDGIHAAWLGRIAGCNLGKPVELGDYWTVDRIADYLRLTDSYPLRDYFIKLDPQPEGFELRRNWPETTRGNVAGSARDDDIDYTILGLHLLETYGPNLTPDLVGRSWMQLLPIGQMYTAERAAYANLVDGVRAPRTASRRNPYREWIGAQIRADVFGYVHAGNPWGAARASYQDAALSHTGNGIYGEMWAAALVASAFVTDDAKTAIVEALRVVPPRSRLAEAIRHVLRLHGEGSTWEYTLNEIHSAYGHYSWVHTINNAAAVVAALLWAEGDFTTAVGRVVMSGWDTDSNGATVGSVAGILSGTANLPPHLISPLQNRTRSALFGFDNSVISELAERTILLFQSTHD
ncbi:ADP-ribosylglycohydrolase family protein [Microbacterium luteolum]|uniref:ADP-ribosylglycohydrolase family protein n=1 Tax=Microbacterium luteolum TaxID=69367 RepID=A0ABY7XQ95_MICLT|nr:ADP-ribosylglycohydrolase family protein [Microbacterium luteolum]WDM44338.1 ADP-ribosylglycohydrolase family protein [Microbacterium luteolum]